MMKPGEKYRIWQKGDPAYALIHIRAIVDKHKAKTSVEIRSGKFVVFGRAKKRRQPQEGWNGGKRWVTWMKGWKWMCSSTEKKDLKPYTEVRNEG